jgi:hypothetical protein
MVGLKAVGGVGMLDAGWAQAFATMFLGLVGLWFANGYRRHIKIQLVERQVDAYVRLFRITERVDPDRTAPLTSDERRELFEQLVKWYFQDGDGLFLSASTRDLYFGVRTNLVCPDKRITPPRLARQIVQLSSADAERRRGCVSVRQVSLLRAQLKSDLDIHRGYWYFRALRPDDQDFLRACGLSVWRNPWRRRLRVSARRPPSYPCLCQLCDDDNQPAAARSRDALGSQTL